MSTAAVSMTLDQRLAAVPPFPAVGLELMAMVTNDDVGIEDVVAAVRRDPTLAAKVLRYANSATLMRSQAAESVHDAVRTLGVVGSLRYLTTQLSATTLAAGAAGYGQDGRKLWMDAVVGARAAQAVAGLVEVSGHVAYTAALLRDIGKMALTGDVSRFQDQLVTQATAIADFTDAERAVFETAHPELGAELARRWRFPDPLVEAIRWHHRPSAATKHHQIVAAVHLGDVIAAMAGATGVDGFLTPLDPTALRTLGLDDDAIIDVVIQAAQWSQELAELDDA
ncbi:MAG: hypothetical protein AMXMBFR64_21840 [Myxococcales bacterium]